MHLYWRRTVCLRSIEWQLRWQRRNNRKFCTSLQCENLAVNRCDSTQERLFSILVCHRSQHSFLRGKVTVSREYKSYGMAFSPGGEVFNAGDQSRFENMMKLLLFLEAELQLKEEIIDLLLVCIVQFWYYFYLVYRKVAKVHSLKYARALMFCVLEGAFGQIRSIAIL